MFVEHVSILGKVRFAGIDRIGQIEPKIVQKQFQSSILKLLARVAREMSRFQDYGTFRFHIFSERNSVAQSVAALAISFCIGQSENTIVAFGDDELGAIFPNTFESQDQRFFRNVTRVSAAFENFFPVESCPFKEEFHLLMKWGRHVCKVELGCDFRDSEGTVVVDDVAHRFDDVHAGFIRTRPSRNCV